MCTQKPPHDFSQQLYDKYKEAFDEYIKSMVGKSLQLMFLHFTDSTFVLNAFVVYN